MPFDKDKHARKSGRELILLKDIMNRDYQVIHTADSIRTCVSIFREYKLQALPVVDEEGLLIGVFTTRRLFRALLDGAKLEDPCTAYIINDPIYNYAERTYDELSLVARVTQSKVEHLPVVDQGGKVVGIAGNREYLRTSIEVIAQAYALLESIFQAIQEGIITVDHNCIILRANQAAENMFGISFTEIQGMNINDVFPEIHYTSKSHLGVRHVIRTVPVIVNQVPIVENNEQIGTNFVFLNVSDIEEIAKELEIVKDLQTTLNGVLSSSSDGVFVSDKFGMLKFANKMASNLLGGDIESFVGHSIAEILGACSLAQVAKTGIPEVGVCRIKERSCIVSHVPIRAEGDKDSRLLGVVSTVYLDDNKLTDEITRKWFSLRQQVKYYRDELEKQGGNRENNFDLIITKNEDFMKIRKEAQRIAKSSSTILLTGESGVGKDMFARAIHASSPRFRRAFIKVNCAAIPETLFESELFGYDPGAFTGASKKGKAGYFEQAHESTIFLDEIGDMPISMQVKILQVLQEKQFMRVGGTRTQKVDVRIIAATNRDLRDAISKGKFREDLYYRLNVIELYLPPLRARSEDIISLAESFVEKYNSILGTKVMGISKRAQEALQRYTWPGNIRELENAIERAANYVWEGEIDTEHLPIHILRSETEDDGQSSYQMVLSDVDKELILEALRKTKGNKSAAARLLKISRSAFYEKLTKYMID